MPYANKEDRNARDRELYRIKRDAHPWVVYKLTDNYVGITKYLRVRMNEHKKQGNPVENYKVLWKFNRPEPAIIVEAIYHWLGYKGCKYGR